MSALVINEVISSECVRVCGIVFALRAMVPKPHHPFECVYIEFVMVVDKYVLRFSLEDGASNDGADITGREKDDSSIPISN